MNRRIGGAYGKPWSKMVGKPIEMSGDVMKRLGETLVESVVSEAQKDFAKQGTSAQPGAPEGLPNSKNFFTSFHYRIVGKSTVEIYSDWPYIQQVMEGRDPYPMTWLVGGMVVPIKKGGETLFRTTPMKKEDAWIHPGFARHTFLQRGIKKGREKMAQIMVEEALKTLSGGDILK